ncbi:sugar (pentulose or hexulose) kinase [Lewinella marina]|uniref:Carbohydrate kinase n=1 Tax=Neolewinella marina TaxID=438751 RepID=A0A2G0CCT3_9BACT|nr:FGGY family carbohydrate kinase [Neolewinella marina]NJB87568.1 sugar (pentulose or hexulose) kinase [Neolewinella marina]PHK97740.1 carbohydrate kinase [Neolewinella marina]
MEQPRVTAVFDIGRTNKKFFLFDDHYREVHREYIRLPETTDEDGYPTEDLSALRAWLREVFDRILTARNFDIHSINFSSYGASLVHLDADGEVVTPLYNYTKPCDPELAREFYDRYGPEPEFTAATGSPPSGLLNSGMQLYWLKHRRPEALRRIRYSLHLPQYLSYVFTGIPISEYTSIGCHTALWDYRRGDYHDWVHAEELHRLLPPIVSTETSINMNYGGRRLRIGVGIHDSSAALLPYIRSAADPFVLVSTGTWSITLNPFAQGALSVEDLEGDCINYMRIDGRPVRAARLFLGQEYRQQVGYLTDHFGVDPERHRAVRFDPAIYAEIMAGYRPWFHLEYLAYPGNPATTTISTESFDYAYHQLMVELVDLQVDSIRAAIGDTPLRTIFIDGGFSDNEVFLQLISHHFRELELRTTDSSLGSALGAAISISDRGLNSRFLEKNYGLKKHQPFIIKEAGA